MDPLTNPSIVATLQDYMRSESWANSEATLWTDVYNDFLRMYHVEDWGITLAVFKSFLEGTFNGKRCRTCGDDSFPYFMEGDKECVRCLT